MNVASFSGLYLHWREAQAAQEQLSWLSRLFDNSIAVAVIGIATWILIWVIKMFGPHWVARQAAQTKLAEQAAVAIPQLAPDLTAALREALQEMHESSTKTLSMLSGKIDVLIKLLAPRGVQ